MAKLNKTCGICRKKYSYCPSCASYANKPKWMAIFCCENCKDIYDVVNDYRYKLLSKEEAFDKLSKLDLSCRNELPKNFQEIIAEILFVEPVKQVDEVVELVKESDETEVEEVKPAKPRKKTVNKKVEVVENATENE